MWIALGLSFWKRRFAFCINQVRLHLHLKIKTCFEAVNMQVVSSGTCVMLAACNINTASFISPFVISDLCGAVGGMVTPKGSMSTEERHSKFLSYLTAAWHVHPWWRDICQSCNQVPATHVQHVWQELDPGGTYELPCIWHHKTAYHLGRNKTLQCYSEGRKRFRREGKKFLYLSTIFFPFLWLRALGWQNWSFWLNGFVKDGRER